MLKSPSATSIILRLLAVLLFVLNSFLQPAAVTQAANPSATLTITPNSWNVIGLDSNTPSSGPYRFPVGGKVCSSSPTTNVVVDFIWDDTTNASAIYLRGGTSSSVTIASLAASPNNCANVYFEVEVYRDLTGTSFDKTRRYHITATDSTGYVSTPTPRELYVEHLISQNRNSITDVKLNGTSIPAGGSMNLMVGNTYTIKLYGSTATQGYNQFEEFINFPNTIFQILSVSTTYSADSNTTNVPNPNDSLYANACIWDNNPNSPTYRSCIGGDDKAGGSSVVTTYSVKILSSTGGTDTLNTLLYDFSGSSFHYNADYSTAPRIANVIPASAVGITKSFNPRGLTGTPFNSVLTIKLTNPASEAVSGVNFIDVFPTSPAAMTLADTTTTNTCSGSLTDSGGGSLNAGDVGIKLTGGTISANSTCTITVNVTVPSAGTYINTTDHLFYSTDIDTGNTATDTLKAATAAACTPGVQMVRWGMDPSSTTVPPAYSSKSTQVATATASVPTGVTSVIDTSLGSPAVNSWSAYGFKGSASFSTADNDYFQFLVDTSKFQNVTMSFNYYSKSSAGPTDAYLYFDNGTGQSATAKWSASGIATGTWRQSGTISFTNAETNSGGNTTFRVYGFNANNNQQGADFVLDEVIFTGCSVTQPAPTIQKTFLTKPIAVGGTSSLQFTVSNTAAGNQALTGIAFTDVLPAGLSVSNGTASCGGTNNVTITASTRTIAMVGGSLASNASCSFSVSVTGVTAGSYDNVTSFILSNESGTSTNLATDSITVVAPPVINKSFSPTAIFTNGSSTISFTVSNPNSTSSLSGIGFTDSPLSALGGLVVATPNGLTGSCGGGTITATAGSTSISLSGATLAANASCNFSVNVTATTAGSKVNTTSAVTSTEGGNGNIGSATLVVANQTALVDLNKMISTSASGPWSKYIVVGTSTNVYYRFAVYNSGDVNLTSATIYDATLVPDAPNALTCTWKTVSGADFTFPLIPGDTAYCTTAAISTNATKNIYTNSATVTAGSSLGNRTSLASTAVYANPALTITKNVTETYYTATGNTLHYTYTVSNAGFASLLGPVTVSDDKVNSVTCGSLTLVGDLDEFFDPGESVSCAGTYSVTDADVTAKSITNKATGSAGGYTSNEASKTIVLAPDLSVTKTNDATSSKLKLGGTFKWTLTLTNAASAGTATFQDTQVLLRDDLPSSGATYSAGTVQASAGVSGTGSINCAIATNTLTCSAKDGTVILAPGANFSLEVTVTPTTSGDLVNPRAAGTCKADPNTILAEIDETNNTCSNTVTVIGKPTIAKSFEASTILVNTTSTMTFTLSNPNTIALTGVSFSDDLTGTSITPKGVSGTQNAGGSCSRTAPISISDTDLALSFSGLSISAGSSCTVTVEVTSGSVGTHNNTTSGVSSVEADTSSVSNTATLNVIDSSKVQPTIAKAFETSPIIAGGTSKITFTLSNTNDTALTGANFDDTLSNMAISGIQDAGGTCTGASTNHFTDGATSLNFAGLTIPKAGDGGSCTVTVVVTSSHTGINPNSTSGVTTDQTTIGTASNTANLTVIGKPTISKAFSPTTIMAGGSSTITFTLTNPNTTVLNGASFSDTLVNMSAKAASGSTQAAGGTCSGVGSNSFTDGDTSLSFSGLTLYGSGNNGGVCTVTVRVISSTLGDNPNSASGVASTESGSAGSASNSAALTVKGYPTIAKEFNPASIVAGDTSTILFTLSNPNAFALTAAGFSDTLVNMSAKAASGTSQTPGGTCVGADQLSISDGTSLSFSGLTIPAASGGTDGSCTVTVVVTSSSVGAQNNTTGGVSSAEADTGLASNTATLNVYTPPTVTKSFGASSVLAGASTTMTLTLTNPNTNPGALTGVWVEDVFPTGLSLFDANFTFNPSTPCGAVTKDGSAASAEGDVRVYFAAATLAKGATCSVQINIKSASAAAGTLTNTTTEVQATGPVALLGGTGNADLTVLVLPTISKSFGVTNLASGGSTNLTLAIGNTNASAITLTSDLIDTFPSGMTIKTAGLQPASTCGASDVTATAGTGSLTLKSGASIPASGCTVIVEVTSSTAGAAVNTIAAGDLKTSTGNNAYQASATLNVYTPPTVTKTFGVSSVLAGASTTMTLTLTNPNTNPGALTGVWVEDVFPTGLSLLDANFTFNPSTPCGAVTKDGSAVSAEGDVQVYFAAATLAKGATCSVQINIKSASAAAGILTNTTTEVQATGPVALLGGTGSADLTVLVLPTISKSFGVTNLASGGSTNLTLTIGNTNASAITLTSDLIDTFPSGMTIKTAGLQPASTCSASDVTATAGAGSLTLKSGASIPASGCTVIVEVTSSTAGAAANTIAAGALKTSAGNNATQTSATLNVYTPPTVTKAFGASSIQSADSTTLTLTLTNPVTNPGTLTGLRLDDTFPSGMTLLSVVSISSILPAGDSARRSAPACGTITKLNGNASAAGDNAVSFRVSSLLVGASCQAVLSVTSSTAGQALNTTDNPTASGPVNLTGTAAQASLTVNAYSQLTISKTDSLTSVKPEDVVTYAVVIANQGPNAADGAVFTDPAVAGLNVTAVSCSAPSGGAACPASADTTVALLQGAGIVIPTLPVEGSLTFSITARVTAYSGTVNNTARVTPPAGGSAVEASDQDTVELVTDLRVTKTNNKTTVRTNDAVIYTVLIENWGSPANDAVFKDGNFSGMVLTGVTCGSAAGGAVCPTLGTDALTVMQTTGLLIPTFPHGGSLVFTINATITAAAGTRVSNMAVVNPPPNMPAPAEPATESSVDSDPVDEITIRYVYIPMAKSPPLVVESVVTLGYEDLPLLTGKNDYDFNDWNVSIKTSLSYIGTQPSSRLTRIDLAITPNARGGNYDYQFQLVFPATLIAQPGTATLVLYDADNKVISTQSTAFTAGAALPVVIFNRVSDIFPLRKTNVYEGDARVKPRQTAALSLVFSSPTDYRWNLSDANRPDASGLIYDPYLNVLDTGEAIHSQDVRLLSVPVANWLWPEETVRIDNAYPLVGFAAGTPPVLTFPANWWLTKNNCVLNGIKCGVP